MIVPPTGTYASRKAHTVSNTFFPSLPLPRTIKGVDTVDDRMFTTTNTPAIFQSTDRGLTWSTDKTLPSGITDGSSMKKFLRWGPHIYTVGVDAGDNLCKLYRTLPAAGNTAFSWSAALLSLTVQTAPPAPPITTLLNGSSWGTNDYLFVGDYSDPIGGPSLWRSPDGTTWTKVLGPIATTRHMHCVAPDPYRPGHVWLTLGDGQSQIVYHSTDRGATWTLRETGSDWQAVQISFDANYIYFAGDSGRLTFWVYRRSDVDAGVFVPRIGATNFHAHHTVPGTRGGRGPFTDGAMAGASSKNLTSATAAFTADDVGRSVFFTTSANPFGFASSMRTYIASFTNSTTVVLSQASTGGSVSGQTFVIGGDAFYQGSYFSAVDPATGIYYAVANDATSGGNRSGLFACPEVGGRLELVEQYGLVMSGEMFIYQGKVYCSQIAHPLLSLAAV